MLHNVHDMRIADKGQCALGEVAGCGAGAHTAHMLTPIEQRHFLRQWRKSKGKTLEQVAEYVGMTHQNLGKIERHQVPATDELLAILADLYGTDMASLVMRDPSREDARWSVWDEVRDMTPKQAQRALRLVRTVADEDDDQAKAG